MASDPLGNGWELLALLLRVLHRTKVEGEFVDLARKLERNIVPILEERYPGARIQLR